MARIFTDLQSAQASAERIMSLLETEPDILDNIEILEQSGFDDEKNWPEIKGEVVLKMFLFHIKLVRRY